MQNKVMTLLLCNVFLCAEVWATESQSINLVEGLVVAPAHNVAGHFEDSSRAIDSGGEFSWDPLFSPALSLKAYGYDRAWVREGLRAQCVNSPGAIGCIWSR